MDRHGSNRCYLGHCSAETEMELRVALQKIAGKTNKEIAALVINQPYVLGLVDLVTAKRRRRQKSEPAPTRRLPPWHRWARGVFVLWEQHLIANPRSSGDLRDEWRIETLVRLGDAIEQKGLFGKDPTHPGFVGFLRQVIENKAAKAASWMLKREEKRDRVQSLGETDVTVEDESGREKLLQMQMDVRDAIGRIANERVRMVMEEFGKCTYREIANKLGLTHDQVRQAIKTGMEIVKTVMSALFILITIAVLHRGQAGHGRVMKKAGTLG